MKSITGPLDADHGDAVVGAQGAVGQWHTDGVLRGDGLDHREVVLELDVVEHPAGHEVRDAFPHVVLGQHHVVRADPLQDPAVLAGRSAKSFWLVMRCFEGWGAGLGGWCFS
jgi:hypothetical protein